MAGHYGSESDFEEALVQRLVDQGYEYRRGGELDRDPCDVVLKDELRGFLRERYSALPDEAIDEAARRFASPDGVDTRVARRSLTSSLEPGLQVRFQRYPRGYPRVNVRNDWCCGP